MRDVLGQQECSDQMVSRASLTTVGSEGKCVHTPNAAGKRGEKVRESLTPPLVSQ